MNKALCLAILIIGMRHAPASAVDSWLMNRRPPAGWVQANLNEHDRLLICQWLDIEHCYGEPAQYWYDPAAGNQAQVDYCNQACAKNPPYICFAGVTVTCPGTPATAAASTERVTPSGGGDLTTVLTASPQLAVDSVGTTAAKATAATGNTPVAASALHTTAAGSTYAVSHDTAIVLTVSEHDRWLACAMDQVEYCNTP